MQGGLSVNTVPDRATIEIDRRVLPGEDPLRGLSARRRLSGRQLADAQVDRARSAFMHRPGLGRPRQWPAGRAACWRFGRGVAGRGEKIGVPYGTNAAATSAAGVPSVVFGPGSIDQAHTADEWLALDQLELASEVYYRFAARLSAAETEQDRCREPDSLRIRSDAGAAKCSGLTRSSASRTGRE